MDLHAVRLADKPPVDRETLAPDELADRYRKAAASGAGWHRWSFYWDLVERAGQLTWGVSDGIVARDVAHGLATLAVVQGMPPGVKHLAGAPEGIGAPIFLRADGGGTDDPAAAVKVNPANPWAGFVSAVVTRYRPGGDLARAKGWGASAGIRAWEIGNEPNLPAFWRGSAADYARYLEVGYLVIKRVDRRATVLHGGIADDGNAPAWYAQFADALKARAAASPLPVRYNYFFDKAAWHWYRSPSLLATGPERGRAILAARGIPPKPIWVTEAGLSVWSEHPGPCWDPASHGRATVAEQAGYVWQALAEGFASGVETIFYFQLYDDCGNGPASYDAFGLVRNHVSNQCWTQPGQGCWSLDTAQAGAPRPAYEAFRVAARELAGARFARQVPAAAGWRQIVFARPGARVTVAWSTRSGDLAVPLDAAGEAATVYGLDSAGNVVGRRVAAVGGRLGLTLSGITNHNGIGGRPIMAGRPVVVVEGSAVTGGEGGSPATGPDTAPPVLAVVAPLPPVSPAKFELTVVAGDEGTGLAAFVVYAAEGATPPRVAEDWVPIGGLRVWPGGPIAGQIRVPFEGKPGRTYFFAAQAADRAGHWTALPPYAQAATRVAGRR